MKLFDDNLILEIRLCKRIYLVMINVTRMETEIVPFMDNEGNGVPITLPRRNSNVKLMERKR